MNHPDEILDFAIAGEELAAAFYRSLAERAEHRWTRDLLLSFAAEEDGHRARLLAVKQGGQLRPSEKPVLDLQIGDYLVEVEPTASMSFQEVLIVAMKREKAAFKLYTDLAEVVADPAARALFLALAQEEARHKLRFELEYDEHVLREN
jgi:rubrerythrin